ncbi:hypothetical protein [Bacillus suaedaesalsae]|uniref:RNA polymerase subunit sigma n=1 Tax=Bacillus suaedaesalsae TaxID=2810349 RepID=A0ABS2DLQ7_9BACI|nr:hypothetical protein [Bacillus suaedaesalsae]MBM6618418.1 hypothetical protein [Bacillus suaedaesalsae]
MGIRLAELQVALPKTQDVSKIVEQMQNRGQHMQDHIAEEVQKQEDRKRRQVVNAKQKDGASLHLRSEHNHEEKQYQKKKNKENHPFKGKSIDISL